ncbi:hypothetical protein BGZ99_006248 [Dissophora globulifera]|uniref:Uncharacterized protein n=1 Tax=Dissophora globulifera TaxID=979702 RepID=A0A9P6RSH5_9FUNG|nr:hypothetical protein BGZ99_006248 [Dissophora globulifera]
MHRSAALSLILEIPLIRDEIASFLSSSAHIVLSNHRKVSLFQDSSAIQQGLYRNSDNVRSIKSNCSYIFQSLPQNDPFRNLVRLDSLVSEIHCTGIVDYTNTKRLLQFIKTNTSVREIILSNFSLESGPISRLLGDTIAQHPGLEQVTINCYRNADLSNIQEVLRGAVLSKVHKLTLTSRSKIFWSAELNDVMEAANELDAAPYLLLPPGHMATELKDLKLDADLRKSLNITLLPLLRISPNLERLFVPVMDVISTIKVLSPILEGWCPKLRHLEGGYSFARDEHQAMLLRSCRELRTYIMRGSQPMGPLSMDALLHTHGHGRTLERLDIKCCSAIESRHLQLILTSCPNLTSFKTLSKSSIQSFNEPRLSILDLPVQGAGRRENAWICTGLRELYIGFTGFSTLQDQASAKPFVDYIYTQLAALTELRTLHLAGEVFMTTGGYPTTADSAAWAFDFTVSSGLGKLQTLTKLRTLNIQKLRHHRMGRDEVEWVASNWPKLDSFCGPPDPAPPVLSSGGGGGDVAGREVNHHDPSSGSEAMIGYVRELMHRLPTLIVSVVV